MSTNNDKPDPGNIRLLVFDLDGTLIDSKLDLALAINATRQKCGLADLPHEQIYGFIGDGARTLIQRTLKPDASKKQVDEALWFFIRYYSAHSLDNTAAYPGVREGLDRLSGDRRVLTILTNKPERISVSILNGMDLDHHFRVIYGGNTFETKKPDPEGLNATMKKFGASPEQTLVIGDSPIDVQTARNANAWVCGVTYGIASHALSETPPDFSVDSLEQLADWAGKSPA